MITEFRSVVDTSVILASVINHSEEIGRIDASSTEEILQASAITLPKDKTIKPHIHKLQTRHTRGTQEAWVVIKGLLLVTLFDTDEKVVTTIPLIEGDCFVLYRGGHTFQVMSDDAKIFEIKNGPYYGAEFDAQPITN